jgi:hypothetical protein
MVMRRWLALSPVERSALVAAFLTQLVIAVVLRILPFPVVRRALARTARPDRSAKRPCTSIPLLQWAAAASGRRIGRPSTCLTRALTVQWLAARRGIVVPVHIGVRRERVLAAHAWIGESAAGAAEPDAGYSRLVSFGERS